MVRLKVYDDQEKLKELQLGNETISVGREPGNTLVLSDPSVSRRHAQIEPNGNFFLIRDNGSTNGTFVNEMLVRTHVLNHGDTVRVGKYLLRIDTGRQKDHDSTRVRVEQLTFPAQKHGGTSQQPTSVVRFEEGTAAAGSSHSRLLRLHEIQGEIGHIDAPQPLLERALEIILAELGAERGSFLLCEGPVGANATAARLFVPAAVRSLAADGNTTDELVIPEELLAAAATQAQGVKSDAPGPPRRSCLAAPLKDRNAVKGIVYIERGPSRDPFNADDLQFLCAIAGQAAISLSNAQLFSEAAAEKDKLQAVFTSLTDGVLVTDPQFIVLEANQAVAVLLGLRDGNPLGASLFDLFAGFDLKPEPQVLRASTPREGAIFQLMKKPPEGKDVGESFISGSMTPYPPGAADPRGVVVILRDRSEVLRMETLKTQFIGNVAHKLRSPLTVIEGNLPLLRTGTGETEQILEEVERNSRALCHLVNEFTEFVEMEMRSARFRSAPEPVKLKPLLREAVRVAEKDGCQRGILVVERVKDSLPSVPGRPEHLLRAFRHILDNAVKFSRHGGQVLVEAEDLGGYVRVDFVDDGPGIPREQLESVFYVCHQVDAEQTGQVPGAGLGLTVARHIVQEHGGDIRITSPHRFPEHGTRVSVVLPSQGLKRDEAAAGTGAAAAGSTPAAGATPGAATGSKAITADTARLRIGPHTSAGQKALSSAGGPASGGPA